jgi:hypothetical protein
MKLITKWNGKVDEVLGISINDWKWLLGIIGVTTLVTIGLLATLIPHEEEHTAFNASISTMSCIELESIILHTWEGDYHFVEDNWEQIGTVHNLRCKA